MFKIFKKPSKHNDFFSDFKRQQRNRRYYLRHKEQIKEKRREYYLINGK
jgi:hypothetical protein